MACVLVHIHTVDARATPASLQVLGEARRIASSLGATLYAAAAVTPVASQCEDLIQELGEHGADRVFIAAEVPKDRPALWQSRSALLTMASTSAKPQLVLLSADACARDLAPRLAANMGALFLEEPAVHYGAHGEVLFNRSIHLGQVERVSSDAQAIPIVATLPPGSYKPARSSDEAEAIFLDLPKKAALEFEVRSEESDKHHAVDTADRLVSIGAGLALSQVDSIRKLASRMGATVCGTYSAYRAGLVEKGEVVDIAGRQVSPRLYFAIASSGSPAHLAALGEDTVVVAVNPDRAAPIMSTADFTLPFAIQDIYDGLSRNLGEEGKA